MKKIFTIAALAAAFTFGATNSAQAQAQEKGDFLIDAYIGTGATAFVYSGDSVNSFYGYTDYKNTGVGPFGLKFEYMLGEKVSIGADVFYKIINEKFTDPTGIDTATNSVVVNEVNLNKNRFRAQVRLNFYLVNTDNFTSYFGLGAGLNNRAKVETVNGVKSTENFQYFLLENNSVNFSARMCLGARYMFTDNLGINGELGLGGATFLAGITYKL